MDTLRNLIETLKNTSYEVLAVLLPAALLLYTLDGIFAISVLGTPERLAASYVLGMAIQGAANFLTTRRRVRRWIEGETPLWRSAEISATKLVQSKHGMDVPEAAIFDVCLTHVDGRRQVYDKFVALRDATRGLVLAWVLGASIQIYQHWSTLTAPGGRAGVLRPLAAIVAAGIVAAALLERYRTYAQLPKQVVYGQFIATHLSNNSSTPGDRGKNPDASTRPEADPKPANHAE